MAYITWTQENSVEVKEIDDQHKKLFAMLNDFYEKLMAGQGKEVMGKLIQDLAEYAVYHFATEEKYFTQLGYPDYPAHKAEHDAFVKKVSDLQKRYMAGGFVLSAEVTDFVKDWLKTHTTGTDRKYIPFFHSHGIR